MNNMMNLEYRSKVLANPKWFTGTQKDTAPFFSSMNFLPQPLQTKLISSRTPHSQTQPICWAGFPTTKV